RHTRFSRDWSSDVCSSDLLLSLEGRALRAFRRQAQMVFQDPFASLNPRLSAGYQLAEPLRVHGLVSGRSGEEARAKTAALLESEIGRASCRGGDEDTGEPT